MNGSANFAGIYWDDMIRSRGQIVVRLIGALVATMQFVSCSSLSFQSISSLRKDLGVGHYPAQSDYPGADAVIVLDRTDVKMAPDRNYNYRVIRTVRCVKKIFSHPESEATVDIPLKEGVSLLRIKARTIEPNGHVIEMNPGDFYIGSGEWGKGGVFYADRQRIHFTFPEVRRGSIVEYVCEEEDDRPFPSGEWEFQRDLPVMTSIYTITVPASMFFGQPNGAAEWKWNFKTYNHPDIGKPSYVSRFGQTGLALNFEDTFTWRLDSIPAFDAEVSMPPASLFKGYTVFAPSEWKKWDDASSWYFFEIFNPSFVITDSIGEVSEELTKKDPTEIEKINSIVRFIEGTQYGPDSAGSGNLLPDYPQTVLEDQYGDGKDLAILMISLLKAAGITAEPALLVTRSEGEVDPAFPCWQFNHMIVRAMDSSGTVFWLDPAVLHCRPGMIPPDDEGATALVISDSGTAVLEKVPSSQTWSNGIFMDIRAEVGPGSEGEVHVIMRFEGEDDLAMRNVFAYADSDNVRSYCQSLIRDNFEYSHLTNYSTSPVDSLQYYFTVSFDFNVPNLLQNEGGRYALYGDPLPVMGNLEWLSTRDRTYPVEFDYPYVLRKRVTYTFSDSNLVVKSLPGEVKLATPDFQFSSSYSVEGSSVLLFDAVFASEARVLPVNRFEEAKEFFYGLSKAEGEAAIVVRR